MRPDVGPAAVVEGLSLPQHDDNNEPAAVQQHQAALVMRHVSSDAWCAWCCWHQEPPRRANRQDGCESRVRKKACENLVHLEHLSL